MSETFPISASANERIIQVIARADIELEQSAPTDLGLVAEIASLRTAFENLGHDWEELPVGLQADFGELDDNFTQASEAYLKVCEQLDQALTGRDGGLLQQAKENLSQAQSLLKAADRAANAHFERWSATS